MGPGEAVASRRVIPAYSGSLIEMARSDVQAASKAAEESDLGR